MPRIPVHECSPVQSMLLAMLHGLACTDDDDLGDQQPLNFWGAKEC